MITCDLVGPSNIGNCPNFGLGNQMFQVATLLSLAKDNDDIAIFPKISNPDFGGYHDNIFREVNSYYPDDALTIYIYEEPEFSYTELPYIKGCCYNGYFQSEKYFSHNREYILDSLKFPDSMVSNVWDKYADILVGKTLSLHVRRGDYISLSNIYSLPTEDYYYKALDKFSGVDSVLVFSDDIEWCKNNFSVPNSFYVEGESDITDMLLMSMCKNNIIANSTFSWWGAWLNKYKDKVVIAPKNWFGPGSEFDSKDIIPDSWIKI